VYFDVTEFEDYGKLSNQQIEEMEAQGEDDELAEKRNPADFALWKAGEAHPDDADPGGQTWDSLWGEGRPGWHIECSAMSMTHLGETLDVHVGGQDLVFPHHENEIAQSEAATDQQFAKYWLHVRLLETGGEKMSSSLQNYFTVRNAVAEFGTNAIRMFLLSTAYNNRQTYSEETLDESVERWERLARGYERAVEAADGPDARTKVADEDLQAAVAETREAFAEAMNDDFNTREAITALLELVGAVNKHLDERDEYDYRSLRDAIDTFEELGEEVLGFALAGDGEGDVRLLDELVDLVLDIREQERDSGNYERADDLRDELEALGVEVQDTDDGPEFRLP
jgi:cysteinyl-tRNA synthetase